MEKRPARKLHLVSWLSAATCMLAVCVILNISVPAHGQKATAFKFDFGTGKASPGYTKVLPTSVYSRQAGYGFDRIPVVTAVDRGGNDLLRRDFCTSDKPFFFTVDVPEGNYSVTITLGDPAGESTTTIKAESRRLMAEDVHTTAGNFATRTFTVNIRNSRLKSGEQVRLKADEQPKLDWDNQLTLEFSGARPCISALEITKVDDAVTVYLAGDSTVTDQVREPFCSWGQMLPRFFKPGVAIANHAESGEALKSFIAAKRLEKILDSLRAGDYLFIQFGHNDQKKESSSYAAAFTDYKDTLKLYIAEARKRGANPVLVTSMHRRRFDPDGKVVNTLEDYPEAMRQTAKEEKVPLIDLNSMSKSFYEALGSKNSKKAFLHYPAGTFPEQDKKLEDDSHFSDYGAYELAQCIVKGIRQNELGIARFLLDGVPAFDPAHPDAADSWNLPVSPPPPVFESPARDQAALFLHSTALSPLPTGSESRRLELDGIFYETAQGRTFLPAGFSPKSPDVRNRSWEAQGKMSDGRVVRISATPGKRSFVIRLTAQPDADIIRWGVALGAAKDEYYTGLMERVVDGRQEASWAPGRQEAMNLRGQNVDMIVKPTTSIYAPFYLSSRGYAVFVHGNWPGRFDFCVDDPQRVKIEFEGSTFEMKVYTEPDPATLVTRHAIEAGPPFLPPRWMYVPWRWRDEHSQLKQYYDGTPVTGPFNSQVMEDVLMMKAFGIPCGVYWVDRPWGSGRLGYDDFEIDPVRLPNFPQMIQWLNQRGMQMLLWIAPFFQGEMEREALAKGYNLAGQPPQRNNYPMVDMTNPAAKAYWQEGLAKLFRLGVAAYKLDRGEEDIPESGPFKVFDGRSIRENRNAYPPMYLKAAYDVARKHRGNDFVLMPRGAYTGSSPYGVFWGGDIGGTQEGLRASIIAVQRSALMGYPNWGSDTCGYNQQLMEQEVCARWLGFSCFTPIMEVGPTRNVGFWNMPRDPSYNAELIAIWRLYARLHERLADYSYVQAQVAHRTGMPIVRPLFLVDPKAPDAWANWQTYLYGPDLLVSPIWEKGKRTQEVYLPSGKRWRDGWHPDKVYQGGHTITVHADLHQTPLFIRAGSRLELGDLNREYEESLAVARQKPDLRKLDAEVKAWFDARKQ